MLKRIVFSCLILIIIMFFLEIGLRLAGYAYQHLNYSQVYIKNKPKGDYVILCLGDSFTLGVGAPNGLSYPEQLEVLLAKSKSSRNPIKVYREFRINSSTILAFLKDDLKKYNPDLVVIMTGCNDTWSLQNCRYLQTINGNLFLKADVYLSGLSSYKLFKIAMLNANFILEKFIRKYLIHPHKMSNNDLQGEAYLHKGEEYLGAGKAELALKEFEAAYRINPTNPSLNLRLATIYKSFLHDYSRARLYALKALYYGDSAIVESAYPSICLNNATGEDDESLREMRGIINERYDLIEKMKALVYLSNLSSIKKNKKMLKQIVTYNLTEILDILQNEKVGVVLMLYPFDLPTDQEVEKEAIQLNLPLIKNNEVLRYKILHGGLKPENLFERDGHCNAQGYKFIAENLCNFLAKEKIIDKAASQ